MARSEAAVGEVVGRETFRDRHRRQRRQEFIDTAFEIVVAEGVDALTMQRVTDELQCATGSIYAYFRSKGALIAEVQREALMALARSLQASQLHLGTLLEGEDAPFASLARIVAATRFWIHADEAFPREIELCRRLFTAPEEILAVDEAPPVLSPALALVDVGSGLLDAAAATGALSPGDGFERATIILAGTTGVLLGANMARWDPRAADARRYADSMMTQLFVAWGATSEAVAHADRLVAELARNGNLLPLVEDLS